MKKNIVVFGIVLLFLGLALTPTINSSLVNIQSGAEEEQEDEEYIEIEVYNFKGKYGFEKIKKKITIQEFKDLQNDFESLKNKQLSIEDKIQQNIQIYKDYSLISEDYSYENIKKMADEQKSYLNRIASIGYFSYKLHRIEENANPVVVNLFSFTAFGMGPVIGVSLGFPPWRIIWPFVFPSIPALSVWATAAFAGGSEEGFLYANGLLGDHITEDAHFCIILGFIGVSVFQLIPNYNDLTVSTWGTGVGYSAFCVGV